MQAMREDHLVGKPVKRIEDSRIILGRTSYVDDIKIPGLGYVGILRSPYSHARIKRIDVSRLENDSRVIGCVTGEDMKKSVTPMPSILLPTGSKKASVFPLAMDKVRFVGEPVVAVAVFQRYDVEDVLDNIEIEYELLPPVVEAEDAVKSDAKLYEEWGGNVAYEWRLEHGDTDQILKNAFLTISERFSINRQCAASMETRGVASTYDPVDDTLTVWSSTQWPHFLRQLLSEVMKHPENKLRVIAPDVGGGFGSKQDLYREEVIIPFMAKRFRRPLKWIASRTEDISSTTHCREQVHYAEAAFDREGTLLALRDRILADLGAFGPMSIGPPFVTLLTMTGPYKVKNIDLDIKFVVTNKVPAGAFRSFGYQESCFVFERLLDIAARRLDLDPAEIRSRNLVTEFPYQASTGVVIDSGQYLKMLENGLRQAGYSDFESMKRKLTSEKHRVGIGMAFGILGGGWGPTRILASALFNAKYQAFDSLTLRINHDGGVTMSTGLSPHGTGVDTAFTQLCSDALGIRKGDITISHGDTMNSPYGYGTWGSRSAVVGGSALMKSVKAIKEKIVAIASHSLKVTKDDLEFRDGAVYRKSEDKNVMSIKEAAKIAYESADLPEGIEHALEVTSYYEPAELTTSAGFNIAIVDVDLESGQTKLLRYVIVTDCGKIINPMLVEGQIHGGLAQGIGAAMTEDLKYGEEGQIIASTFMDYLLPCAPDMPHLELSSIETPSPYNDLGIKGVGELGAVGPTAAIANAVCNALKDFNVKVNTTPVTPNEIWLQLNAKPKESAN